MNEREKIIHLWFDMWLQQKDLGIDEIFTDDVIYIESWSPKYENRVTVKHWFKEWNTRGKVLVWDIKQFFHKENQTIVEWTTDNKIRFLREFGCNLNNYNPYQNSDIPQFKEEKANWF